MVSLFLPIWPIGIILLILGLVIAHKEARHNPDYQGLTKRQIVAMVGFSLLIVAIGFTIFWWIGKVING